MTSERMDRNNAVPLAVAWLSMAGVSAYQLLLIALIFLRPDLDPSWHTISEWVIGPYGWLMRVAFFASAVGYAGLFAMLRAQPRGVSGRVGMVLLLIWVVGTVGVGVFTTDPPNGSVVTTTGTLHIIFGSSALALLPFAALFINLSLAYKNKAWSPARRVLLSTAGLPLLGFGSFVAYTAIFVIPLGPTAYGPGVNIGWPPRFAFLTYAVWVVTLAWQGIRLRDRENRAGSRASNRALSV